MRKKGSEPATKDDIKDLARRLDGHDVALRTHSLEFVKVRAEMGAMEERLTGLIKRSEDRVVGLLDRVLARMETIWQESVLLPKALDRHDAALADHERRLTALEAKPAR